MMQDIPPKLQEVKAKQNKTYLVNEFQPSIVCDIVETDKIGVETRLNIVFDKNSTFENTGYINTLLRNAYNSKPQFKEYFSEYDVIYVVKDLHWDNSYSKRGLHFNLKLISEYKTSPMIHAYIHEGIINNMTYISFIF